MTQNNQMFMAEQIPEGYKKTIVGVYPIDWEISQLKSIANFGGGTTPSRALYSRYYAPEGHAWVKTLDLNNDKIYRTQEYITDTALSEVAIKLHSKNTVLVAMYGGFNQIGRTGLLKVDAAINQALVAIKPHSNILDSEFLQYNLNYRVDYWKNVASSSRKDPNITSNDVKAYALAYPGVREQQKIATALSDTGALISELEKLIEKKQAIKTATMQQLLTGKTRLPEFALREDGTPKGYKDSELGQIPEDWELKSYGEIFKFLSTSNNSRDDLGDDGEYSYIHYGDIHTKFDEYVDFSKASFPRIAKEKVSSAFVQSGDLVMADASEDYAGIGKSIEVGNIAQKVVAGLHTFLLRDRNKTYVDGYRAYLHLIPKVKKSMDRLATGMKVYSLSKSTLLTILLPVPPKQEQEKIVIFLQDIDIDLAESKVKLEKLKLIKQGMMQELLTGKTRLV